MNYDKPESLEDLQKYNLTEREAIVAATVLPHLPDDESLLSFAEPPKFGFEASTDQIEKFQDDTTPLVPGGGLYRVSAEVQTTTSGTQTDKLYVEPRPHSIKCYDLHAADLWLIRPADPEECDFSNTDQVTLSEFGAPSYHLQAIDPIATDGGDKFDRKPRFPV